MFFILMQTLMNALRERMNVLQMPTVKIQREATLAHAKMALTGMDNVAKVRSSGMGDKTLKYNCTIELLVVISFNTLI